MRKLMKSLLWPVLPKPWNAPDMEFHHGLWNGVSALYNESGRQLGEGNTRPFMLNHHLPAETIPCKYKGSREGRAINMTALRTAMQNFDAALAITAAVRDLHLSRLKDSKPVGIWDLFIISRASIALVAYQKRYRGQAIVQQSVGDALASQFQFISGVFMICRHMMENADPAIVKNRHVEAEALYAYADEHGIFISFNEMACAGSTKKIIEFLNFCNVGARQAEQDLLALSDIVSDPENWYQYALATVELDCFIEKERALRAGASMVDTRDIPNESAQIFGALGAYVRRMMNAGSLNDDQHRSFEWGALARQNRILDMLGRQPIGKLPKKHIAARLA